jgi:L-alanine-DL-glutamate epimerase-like enolase superfamily enzyme
VPRTPEPAPAARLRDALVALTLVVEDVVTESTARPVPSYGGERPTSVIRLRGNGTAGRGENVAWTAAAHNAFCCHARAAPRGRWRLGEWAEAMRDVIPDPYGRAAAEAAAIDLALRQHRTQLFALAGVAPHPVRYVVSFGRVPDPVAEAERHGQAELKVDADPAWDDALYARLAALGRVAVLDFKGTGTVGDQERAHGALPDALLEDPRPGPEPWSRSLRARLVADAPLAAAGDLDALLVPPAFVNLKPGRMGGVLETLACAARCTAAGIGLYVGGMFEIAAGRLQLRDLAAILSPDAPNDIAPIGLGSRPPARPSRLRIDATAIGFGSQA